MNDQAFELLKVALEDIKTTSNSRFDDLKRGLDEMRQSHSHIEKLLTRHDERLDAHTEKLALADEKSKNLDKKIDDGLSAVRNELKLEVVKVKEDWKTETKEMKEVFTAYSGFWTVTKWVMGGIVILGGGGGIILGILKYFAH